MSTENPLISNFTGLEGLQELFAGVELELDDEGRKAVLNSEVDRFECERDSLSRLGLAVAIPGSPKEFDTAAESAGLDPEDVEVVVVADGSFLRRRAVIKQMSAPDFPGKTEILRRGSASTRDRALQDERHGFDLEVALILKNELTPKPGRPFRAGTRLSSHVFRVRPRPNVGGISPVPLEPDMIEELALPRTTQVFVRFEEDLLEADSVAQAMTVYANEDLLDALRLRRSGDEFDFVGANLAVIALQQLVFELSAVLTEQEPAAYQEPVVLKFLSQKLAEAHGAKASGMTTEQLVSKLKSEPHTLAASLTGMRDYGKSAKAILKSHEGDD